MSVPPEVSGPTTVVTDTIHFDTKGHADMVNITEDVRRVVAATGLRAGIVTVFVPGATGAVTTLASTSARAVTSSRVVWPRAR